ncbi:MAG TPA: hypothetical protein PKB11_08215 [Desulfovibrio sp.]|uniref:hypothetical protein n=1 Tax=Desulfovibrio sp. TaxID=885 RepID=UPI002D050C78|nr:hypothetical protein [Desulfovibrio sp.]HMM38728.1 hypothetical protein [Desulfovibrio sp.]
MRMRKAPMWGMVAALLAVLLMGGAAFAKKMELSFSTVYMNTHPTVVNAWTPWFKEMADLTGGQRGDHLFQPEHPLPAQRHL